MVTTVSTYTPGGRAAYPPSDTTVTLPPGVYAHKDCRHVDDTWLLGWSHSIVN